MTIRRIYDVFDPCGWLAIGFGKSRLYPVSPRLFFRWIIVRKLGIKYYKSMLVERALFGLTDYEKTLSKSALTERYRNIRLKAAEAI